MIVPWKFTFVSMRYLKTYFVFISVVALMSTLSVPAISADIEDLPQSLIVMFGDSIAAGEQFPIGGPIFDEVGDGREGVGCPTIYLTNLLRNEGERSSVDCATDTTLNPVRDRVAEAGEIRNSRVVNWGIGGSSSSIGLARIEQDLTESRDQPEFQNATQRFVLIHYGTNDFDFGISPQATGFNTQQMIIRARALGYTPAVSTLLPRTFRSIASESAAIVQAAQQLGAPIVDMFSLFQNFPGLPDPNPSAPLIGVSAQSGASGLLPLEQNGPFIFRIHPNEQGYVVMIEAWFEQVLEPEIEPFIDNIVITPILDLLLNQDS